MLSGHNDKVGFVSASLPGMRMKDLVDRWLGAADAGLRTLSGATQASRERPPTAAHGELSPEERQLAAALMRVNHVGEVCAQAMYQAQALTARTQGLRQHMERAAREEADHLAWTEERLRELNDRPSLLNPLWYAGAFAIGLAAGRAGDRWSLGFVAETEHQVEEHLARHLDRLPPGDAASRAIVARMKEDEAHHGEQARRAGGRPLPLPLRWAMRAAAKVMTTTAHRI
jgi:ubiquinone biosynthesis monooxygenase Coq7